MSEVAQADGKFDQPEEVKKEDAVVDYDESYKKHLATAERAKSEYERLYREMVDKLSVAHLEPLAKVMLEQENVTLLGQDKIILVLKEKLFEQMMDSLEKSWETCNISNGIVTLEILKDRFREFEGKDWHMPELNPNMRSLPLRMRFKEASKRYLQKQITFQNSKLENLLKINSMNRERIHEITNKRVYLKEVMERETQELKKKQQVLLRLQDELLGA